MEFIDCVSECAKNIIKGNVPLNPAQLRRLCRERVLALKKTSLKKKKRILQFCRREDSSVLSFHLFSVSLAVCCWAMQTAKKLVLVDPQFLEQVKVDRTYKQIQKPADSIARTCLSLDIGKTLNDDTLSDDQKVKRHLQTLNRYYQVTEEVPQLTTSKSNPLTVAAAQTKRKKNNRQTSTPY